MCVETDSPREIPCIDKGNTVSDGGSRVKLVCMHAYKTDLFCCIYHINGIIQYVIVRVCVASFNP